MSATEKSRDLLCKSTSCIFGRVTIASFTMLLSTAARSVATATGLGRRAASAIALKYSKAVYGAALAKSPQILNKVHADLTSVSNSIKDVPEVNAFVNNPTLSSKERATGLASLFSKIESTAAKKEPMSDITKHLLSVLSENGRLGETEGVIEGFNDLVSQYRGELSVVVTSATSLPKDILARLEASLKQSQAGQKAKVLKISNKVGILSLISCCPCSPPLQVNPSVLGGIIVDFGDKTIDLSVQSRVTKLNNVLTRMWYIRWLSGTLDN